jgi:hypothetical protein
MFKRRCLRLSRDLKESEAKFQAEIDRLTSYYERRLEIERQKCESLLFAGVDRAYQAVKLFPITHVANDAAEKTANILDSSVLRPANPEKELTGDVLGFYLDAKDGFWEAEAENGRSDAEIQRLWDEHYRDEEIARAKVSII